MSNAGNEEVSTSKMPKIALDSKEDFLYVKSIMQKITREKLDASVKEIDDNKIGGEDPLRKKVEEFLVEWVSNIFTEIRPNLLINGLEVDADDQEDMEPFDWDLHNKVQQLYGQLEAETEEITKLRKSVPEEIAKLQREQLKKHLSSTQIDLPETTLDKYDEKNNDQLRRLAEASKGSTFAQADVDKLSNAIYSVKSASEVLAQKM